MKSHYTAKELAGRPGLPGHLANVLKLADRENWSYRKRDGRGGGREYPLSALPAETREYFAREAIANAPAIHQPAPVPAPCATIQPAATTSQLKQWQREIMEARVAIMRLIEKATPMVGVNKAINTIVKDAMDNCHHPVYAAANARKGSSRTLSYDGIMKWWRKWKTSGGDCLALAPKDTENYLEPAWAESFMKCWSKPQKPTLTEVLEEFRLRSTTDRSLSGVEVPSYGQARHYLQKLGMIEREKGRKTGKELQSLKPFRRRDTSEMFPGDAFTADGHCFDGEVRTPSTVAPSGRKSRR